MKISVIAIFYNSEKYVRKCIDSIISQKNVDLEIIAVDDCSQDATCSILDQYARQGYLTLIKHCTNQGISESRNTGLKHVTGDCFYMIDGDDWLASDSSLHLLASKFDESVDWVQGSYEKIDESANKIGEIIYPNESYKDVESIEENFGGLNFYYTHNKLFNAKFKSFRFKRERYHEDRIWMAEIFPLINCIESVSIPTYCYLIRRGQTSSQARTRRLYVESGMELMKLMANCPDCWSNIRDTFQIVDIEKPLYLWEKDKYFRISIINELNKINQVKISTQGFPRFNKMIHAGISYGAPDFILDCVSKSYLKIMKLLGKQV